MQTSRLIPSQLPSFIRGEYPAFIEFLQSYYEWLESSNYLTSIENLTDIDKTVDEYLKYFRTTYDVNKILQYATGDVNQRSFLKKIRDLYLSKGSAASIEFIFNVFFNKPVTIKEPWDEVLRISEGVWRQNVSILAYASAGDLRTMTGDIVNLRNQAGKVYRTYVRSIIARKEGIYELFIDRIADYEGPFVQVDMDNFAVVGVVVPTIVKANVLRKGQKFKPGQLIEVTSPTKTNSINKITFIFKDELTPLTSVQLLILKGQQVQLTDVSGQIIYTTIRQVTSSGNTYVAEIVPIRYNGSDIIQVLGTSFNLNCSVVDYNVTLIGGSETVLKVKSVDSEGGITGVEVVKFGSGYSSSFVLAVRADGKEPSLGSRLEFDFTSSGNTSSTFFPTDDGIASSEETLRVVRHNYTTVPSPLVQNDINQGYVALDYVGETIVDSFTKDQITFIDLETSFLILRLGEVCRYPGNYLTSTSILGNLAYIQDSYKYQAFSYVTAVEEPFEKYFSLLKGIIHVAGTKLLGEYTITPNFTLDPRILPALNFIRQQDAIYSYVQSAVDLILDVYKSLESTAIADTVDLTYILLKKINTGLTALEDHTYWFYKRLSSYFLGSTHVTKDVFKSLAHEFNLTDDEFSILTSKQILTVFVLSQIESLVKDVQKRLASQSTASDNDTYWFYKMLGSSFVADTVSLLKDVIKQIESIVPADDSNFRVDLEKPLSTTHTLAQIELLKKLVEKPLTSNPINVSEDNTYWFYKHIESSGIAEVLNLISDVLKQIESIVPADDSNFRVDVSKQLDSIVSQTEQVKYLLERTITNISTVDDSNFKVDFDMFISSSDIVTTALNELVKKTLLREISGQDNVNVQDGDYPTLQADKYLEHNVDATTSGIVYGTPLYAEILPSYWVPGYQDTERVFLN